MIKRVVVLQGALLGVLALGSCKSDPTNTDVGTAAAVAMEFKLRTMAVGDSVRTFAEVVDKFSHPLQETATVATACTPGILALSAASDAPQPRTAFIVKAVGYGTSCVVASAGGFSDTLTVTTQPASLVVTGGPDSIASGVTANYTFAYKNATGAVMSGIPDPALASSDTTIAKIGANLGDVSGRSAGTVTITFTGTAGLSATKTISVVVTTAFNGTTSGPILPGAFLTVYPNAAGPKFDANTAISLGAIEAATRSADSIRVRLSDLASPGAKSFKLTGVGAGDVEFDGVGYTVAAAPAFTGTFTPNPVFPGATVWMHRNAGDPPFVATGAGATRVARGTSNANFAALTVDTSTAKADSFKFTISDLAAGGTYLIRTTRLGATLDARQGSYVLPVGTYGGTVSQNGGAPADKIVLHRGGGDPQFDADTRVYFDGVRGFVDQFSTDTAVVAVPPLGAAGAVDLRLSRMGAAQQAEDAAGAFTSTTASLLDVRGHGNDQPNFPVAVGNGNTYLTLAGTCPGGIPASGGEKCDAYFTITNNTVAPDTVTVTASWFAGATDGDLLICDGSALSNAAPNNVPACGNFAGGADIFDCACNAAPGDGFALDANGEGPPELIKFVFPPGATYVIWVNMFDSGGASATLIQLNVVGLK